MANNFIVQVKKDKYDNSLHRINVIFPEKSWETSISFDTFDKAKEHCELEIKRGHPASEIRICEVIATFDAQVTVNSKYEKNDAT